MAESSSARSSAVVVSLAVLATVALLWWLRAASQLLIPIVIGVLVSYALEPVVAWLARYMPRMLAAAALLLVLAGLTGWGVYSLRDDMVSAAEAMPAAAKRLREMATSRGESGPAADIQKAAEELQGRPQGTSGQGSSGKSTSGQGTQGAAGGKPAASPPPAPASPPTALVQRGVGSVFAFAGNLMTVVFLVFFLLAAGDHFGRRIMEIAGDGENRRVAARVLKDINSQIQRFLLVRLVTSTIVALVTWGALVWLGTPQAAVWAVLAGVFNSIPYFGPVIVSGGLLLVGAVQADLTQGLKMAGIALVITSLEGWLLTPPLLGKAEKMSALVVFLGLLLWTWVWGAWGTILAVPMLVVIKSVADHVEPLKPVSRLMAP